ncbi:MAG TPA: hypothetical protein VMT62_01580 [Syntrophorhabdaceae bacterium]|nr:hypothetical protein [Syntrophorhabdaceae bacterium]
MPKQKDETVRTTYSVRLNPDMLRLLRHIAVDEETSVGKLLEEGIRSIIKKRKAAGYAIDDRAIKSKNESIDIDSRYEIPRFLRKRSDE